MNETTLSKLPSALAKFQAEHHAAGRDGKNNFGTYTTLAGALAAVQPACAHGLAHTQTIQPISDDLMVLRTTLLHESGESITSDLPLPIRQDGARGNAMQALGSALTYARRYGLLAIYGLAGDDDDGETAAPAPKKPAALPSKAAPEPACPMPKPATPTQPSPLPEPAKQKSDSVVFASEEEVKAIQERILAHPKRAEVITEFKKFKKLLPAAKRVADHIQLPEDVAFLNSVCDSLDAA
jgi:hypothetical protein